MDSRPPFRHVAALLPQRVFGQLGWLRGSLGAAIAIATAGLATATLLEGAPAGLPWLIAPLGASAVLVFAVPASPLAQPWSVIGGNLVSASLGLALGMAIGEPALAASLAVGLAIALMTFARCLHPPGGACALLCALGAGGRRRGASCTSCPSSPMSCASHSSDGRGTTSPATAGRTW